MKPLQNRKNGLLLVVILLIGFASFLSAATISGTITGNTALPINHSEVQLVKQALNNVGGINFRSTISNTDGNYNFQNLPAGHYYVYAVAPDYERGFYADPVTGQIQVVEVDADDQEVIGVNIQLTPQNDPPPPPPQEASVRGTVFGTNNALLPNIPVSLVSTDNLNAPILQYFAYTTDSGKYFFHEVQAGTYKACTLGLYLQPLVYSTEFTVANAPVDSINIYTDIAGPPTFGSISGYVIGNDDEENDFDNEYHSVGVVSLADTTTVIPGYTRFVGHEGYYFIYSLPVGTYRTCVLNQENQPVVYSAPVTVIANQVVENVNIMVGTGTTAGYSISGTVLNDQNLPLQDGIVELRTAPDSTNTINNHQHRTAHVNANGEYTITNVPAGQYILSVWAHMSPVVFYPSTFDIAQTLLVNVVDQDLTGLNITIPAMQNFTISGYVLDELTDAPLAGILVKTDRMGFHHFPVQDSLFTNEFSAITDASGHYSIEAPIGRYTVVALDSTHTYHHQFYDHVTNPFHATVFMLTHDFTDVNFDLIAVNDSLNYSISGTVTVNGEAITYPVRVVAVSSDEDWEDTAITGPAGTYSIHHMRPGSYYVAAYSLYTAPSYYNNALDWESAEVISVHAAISGIDFNLQNNSADGQCNLTGTVSALNGSGVEDVVVMLTNAQNQIIGFARTDASGQYTIQNVPSQSYTVIATKIGMSTVTQNLAVIGNENLNLVVNAPTANDDNYVPVTSTKISNYPNPFNPNTNIFFSVAKDSKVNVQIFNIKGQCIKTLLHNSIKAGSHSLKWDGTDNNGKSVTSGIYLVRLQGEGFQNSHKITLMK